MDLGGVSERGEEHYQNIVWGGQFSKNKNSVSLSIHPDMPDTEIWAVNRPSPKPSHSTECQQVWLPSTLEIRGQNAEANSVSQEQTEHHRTWKRDSRDLNPGHGAPGPYFLFAYVCVLAWTHIRHTSAMPTKTGRQHRIPWNCSYRRWRATM